MIMLKLRFLYAEPLTSRPTTIYSNTLFHRLGLLTLLDGTHVFASGVTQISAMCITSASNL